MKNIASMTGWLLLTVVLAVPSVLFYNWWTRNKEKSALERVQGGGSGAVFQPSTAPGADGRPAPQSQIAAGVASPVPAPPGASGGMTAARQTDQNLPGAPDLPENSAGLSAAKSYFRPKSQRDPTVSPAEVQQLKREEYERAEKERQRLADEKRRQKENGIENKLRLQGIIGNSVIINGDSYRVGQQVLGAKILKIGPDYFTGEYKGQKFRKVLR